MCLYISFIREIYLFDTVTVFQIERGNFFFGESPKQLYTVSSDLPPISFQENLITFVIQSYNRSRGENWDYRRLFSRGYVVALLVSKFSGVDFSLGRSADRDLPVSAEGDRKRESASSNYRDVFSAVSHEGQYQLLRRGQLRNENEIEFRSAISEAVGRLIGSRYVSLYFLRRLSSSYYFRLSYLYISRVLTGGRLSLKPWFTPSLTYAIEI